MLLLVPSIDTFRRLANSVELHLLLLLLTLFMLAHLRSQRSLCTCVGNYPAPSPTV